MADCANCVTKAELEELKRDCERNSSQHREFYARFAELEKSIAISDERYNNLLAIMTEVKTSVTEIKEKPSKRWETVIACILTTVVGGIIGAIIKGMF